MTHLAVRRSRIDLDRPFARTLSGEGALAVASIDALPMGFPRGVTHGCRVGRRAHGRPGAGLDPDWPPGWLDGEQPQQGVSTHRAQPTVVEPPARGAGAA